MGSFCPWWRTSICCEENFCSSSWQTRIKKTLISNFPVAKTTLCCVAHNEQLATATINTESLFSFIYTIRFRLLSEQWGGCSSGGRSGQLLIRSWVFFCWKRSTDIWVCLLVRRLVVWSQTPPVSIKKCLWARNWTPNWTWCIDPSWKSTKTDSGCSG